MSTRGYALHSVRPELLFFHHQSQLSPAQNQSDNHPRIINPKITPRTTGPAIPPINNFCNLLGSDISTEVASRLRDELRITLMTRGVTRQLPMSVRVTTYSKSDTNFRRIGQNGNKTETTYSHKNAKNMKFIQ